MVIVTIIRIILNLFFLFNFVLSESNRDLTWKSNAGKACLDWQSKFTQRANFYKNEHILVFHPIGGLSDCLTGMTTAFLISYALQRSFYIPEDAAIWNSIESKVVRKSSINIKAKRKYPLHKKTTLQLLYQLSKNRDEVIHITGNRGSTYTVVKSKEFSKYDYLGLSSLNSEHAFGCLLNFLATPNSRTISHFRTEISLLNERRFKIGLQIRTFETLRGHPERSQAFYMKNYQNYFECVKILANKRENALIFVLSDSITLRQIMVDVFQKSGLDAFTTTVDRDSVVDPWWSTSTLNRTVSKKLITSAEEAFGESMLFSLSNVFVYTGKSGFGRVAAAAGFRTRAFYPIGERKRKGVINSAPMCKNEGFSMFDIAAQSAGI